MEHSRKRVLDMLYKGTITSDEAKRLLEELDSYRAKDHLDSESKLEAKGSREPKYLYIQTKPKGEAIRSEEPAEIRIPLVLVKAGMRLGWLVPESKRQILSDSLDRQGIGIDLSSLNKSNLLEFIDALSKNPIKINTKDESVRIFCN